MRGLHGVRPCRALVPPRLCRLDSACAARGRGMAGRGNVDTKETAWFSSFLVKTGAGLVAGKKKRNPSGSFLCPAQPPGPLPVRGPHRGGVVPCSRANLAAKRRWARRTMPAAIRRLGMARLRAGHGVWGEGRQGALGPRRLEDKPATGAAGLGTGEGANRPVAANRGSRPGLRAGHGVWEVKRQRPADPRKLWRREKYHGN